MRACYTPFGWMFGGGAKADDFCRSGAAYRLTLDKLDADRIINLVRGGSDAGHFDPRATRLALLNRKRQPILLMDDSGGALAGDRQFTVSPNAFLMIAYQLDEVVERQVASADDAVANGDSAVLLAKGFLRGRNPGGRGALPFDWKRARFTARQDKSAQGIWEVTCADGRSKYVAEIARRNGRLIILYDANRKLETDRWLESKIPKDAN